MRKAIEASRLLEKRGSQQKQGWQVRLPSEGWAVNPVFGKKSIEVRSEGGHAVVVTGREVLKVMDWVDMVAALGWAR